MVKEILKTWLPPIALDYLGVLAGRRISFRGHYKSWQAASRVGKGYADQDILDRVKLATDRSLSDPTVFERDGVLLSEVSYPFPLVSTLLLACIKNDGELTVADFGGSLGSTYYQCQQFLKPIKKLTWCVIEQPHFVLLGRNKYENDVLRFYASFEECYKEKKPDVVVLSSVIQYISELDKLFETIKKNRAEFVVIDRTPFIQSGESKIARQVTPASIGKADYPLWLLKRDDVIGKLSDTYNVLSVFNAMDGDVFAGLRKVSFQGIIFQLKQGNK